MHSTKLIIDLQKLVYDDSIMQTEAIDIRCFHMPPCQSLQGLFIEIHLYLIALDKVFPRFDAVRLVIYKNPLTVFFKGSIDNTLEE